jgi:Fur family transcriptional regulator, ferric uptake regulator
MKMTKQRHLLLNLLKQSKKPLSAEELFEALPNDAMNLSTVYRTLEKFFDEALISKSFLNQKQYYYYSEHAHHHYMICVNCHEMIKIDCHLDSIATDIAEQHHFKITHHDMTLYGYCQTCNQ